ncbi:hypothetical protein HPP92_019155 [Vanilla planifolia]|uniref:Uncharacterized protein n=1 Tax=Vanilla planifolia TaxID=51239 RepID=A0A835Q2D6_VANPL|nr:hypothetical protein HPP92_019155 [Vanilla planifolia]
MRTWKAKGLPEAILRWEEEEGEDVGLIDRRAGAEQEDKRYSRLSSDEEANSLLCSIGGKGSLWPGCSAESSAVGKSIELSNSSVRYWTMDLTWFHGSDQTPGLVPDLFYKDMRLSVLINKNYNHGDEKV